MSIVSFEKKFIFLKTRKVAGTSIEAELRKITGENDIVPAVTPRDEFYSSKKGFFSKNYLRDKESESYYTDLVLDGRFEEAAEYLASQKALAPSHMKYARIKSIVENMGYDIKDFFVFTVDRHPYSWVVSSVLYNNSRYNKEGVLYREWSADEVNLLVKDLLDKDDFTKRINWNLYSLGDDVMVDRVLKYEELDKELSDVFSKLGERFCGLPELKLNSRHVDAGKILEKENKDAIFLKMKHVFETLGYDR
ncbi:hypothetical protein [Halomonas huangheensis]|uniref:Sulfotransferase family protein n=1 Tax=Halomonas huangheensis TaxID=1178482 RepID=W1NCI0_9GAMM|nr:hypothetical protein [Halomonas huangheensis]ALM52816.1 hypothetical protein AR456_11390 [Halomonas huangheensis]ERL53272.1 hypothetical protein BJB45_18545 [Halomonas huangheensis]